MDPKIFKLESYSLSGDEMRKYGPKGAKLLTYKQLAQCKTLDEALGRSGVLILLYLTQADNYGHWCCVFKRNNNIVNFFDSYGKVIDEPLDYCQTDVRIRNNEILPHLSTLIYNSGYKIEYNDHILQTHNPNIMVATCGRHVLCRLTLRYLNDDDYFKYMFSNSKFNPDYIVTELTEFIK